MSGVVISPSIPWSTRFYIGDEPLTNLWPKADEADQDFVVRDVGSKIGKLKVTFARPGSADRTGSEADLLMIDRLLDASIRERRPDIHLSLYEDQLQTLRRVFHMGISIDRYKDSMTLIINGSMISKMTTSPRTEAEVTIHHYVFRAIEDYYSSGILAFPLRYFDIKPADSQPRVPLNLIQ